MATEFSNDYREWKTWTSARFGALSLIDSAYFTAELSAAGIVELSAAGVLELGFGNGEFATWARERSAVYCGIEAIQELVDEARRSGLSAFHNETPMASCVAESSLDLVVAFDVFEHIPIEKLRCLLASIHASLKPGALLLARVPAGDSPFSRAIQHGDLSHCTILGSSAVRQLALQVGFEVMAIREPVIPWRGLGLSRSIRRLMIVFARMAAYAFIRAVFMGGGSPVLSPNMIMIWRRPLEN